MPATSYLREKLVRHIAGVEAYTMPTDMVLGLLLQPGGPGSPIVEVSTSGTGYVRKPVSFSYLLADVYENTLPITYECNGTDFGQVTHYGVWDGDGNMLWTGNVSPSAYVGDQDSFLVSAGEVRIMLV